jgi:outer membrane protein TolC/AcrR family transcriptional regulator
MTNPTRDQLLTAAARLYGEHGFRGTTTRRIAEEARVNEVTIFRLFGSKGALLLEAIRTHGTEVAEDELPLTPGDPLTELTAWSAHQRSTLRGMRSMIRKCMSEFEERPDMPKCMEKGANTVHARLFRYFERLEDAGLIDAGADIRAAAAMLLSSLFHDAIARDMYPDLFPHPSVAAPAAYARLALQSLGYNVPSAARRPARKRRRMAAIAFALFSLAPLAVRAQSAAAQSPQAISLADAMALAEKVSHTVRTAEAGVLRSQGQQLQAHSQYLPQLNGSAQYQRTLQSQFQALAGSGSSTDTSKNSAANAFGDITKIFAAPNTVTLGLTLQQNLFTAGKLTASTKSAEASRTVADIGLLSARAQLALTVAQAYYDAVASEQLVQIADSTLAQTERTLQQTEISRQVGSSAEFDLLRARVTRDNQRPVVIQARGTRDVAMLHLRQLLGIPLQQPLTLTTPIHDDGVPGAETQPVQLSQPITIPGAANGIVPDTSVGNRAGVRQAEANVTAQEYALKAANWNRLPSVQLTSNYQRIGYPPDGTFLPNSFGLFYPNWTAAVGLSIPVFLGGKLAGDRMVAEANVNEARQTLLQTRELAELDARTAITQLDQTQAAYAASVGTDQQAARAYAIAEVRYREGISTQVELDQSRTQLQQARLNRVQAARDLEVARLKVALLKDLPLSATGR